MRNQLKQELNLFLGNERPALRGGPDLIQAECAITEFTCNNKSDIKSDITKVTTFPPQTHMIA